MLGASIAVTMIAVAGGFGVLPKGSDGSAAATSSVTGADRAAAETAVEPFPEPVEGPAAQAAADSAGLTPASGRKPEAAGQPGRSDTALPPESGTGRRVVFSEGRQRVWLVDAGGKVVQTHLASGSIYDNLDPGTYEVYSRSRWATGIDDSGTMEYFVRFTQGTQGAAIGFHSIPVDDGKPVQTLRQLGTPLSHGCIRQKRSDAIAVWEFAPIGTTVVVTP